MCFRQGVFRAFSGSFVCFQSVFGVFSLCPFRICLWTLSKFGKHKYSFQVFHPTFYAKSPEPIFGDFKGFPQDSRRLSIELDRFFIILNQLVFQPISINFNQFQSVSPQEFIDNQLVGKTARKACAQPCGKRVD